jgi:Cytochrome c
VLNIASYSSEGAISILRQKPRLRIDSSQTEKPISVPHVRWSRLVLGFAAALLGLGGALAARRVLSQPATHLARSASPSASLAASASTLPAPAEPVDAIDVARERLAQFEAERRRATDFSHLPPANLTHGADPYALAALNAQYAVGVLRGASAIVLLDAHLREWQRIDVPGSAVAVTVTRSGECWVAGETAHSLTKFYFDGRRLIAAGTLEIPGILGLRALAAAPEGLLYALDVHDGRLLTLDPAQPAYPIVDSRVIGHGPLSVRRVGSSLIVNALLDHALLVLTIANDGRPLAERARIHHDGPLWGFDAAALPQGELLITVSGVEDHPLDRGDGSFGYIDSFAFAYMLPEAGAARELWRTNVSELGVVTPKAPLLRVDGERARLFLSGYGSDRAVELYFDAHAQTAPTAQSEPFYPGTSAAIRLASGDFAFADPLFDSWLLRPAVSTEGRGAPGVLRSVEAEHAPRASAEERLGEALFFTTLMAPNNSSEGKQSRFTCETCHFEGYVDGRVHYTGRADVFATTKPLRGLFNNRPHFSRALDADLSTVSHHEFRVAGKGNGTDPWFDLERADFPWLAQLGVTEQSVAAEALRRALIAFLMRFSHTTNPAVVGRAQFEPNERHGAELFRARCASCHAPRLQSDVPESAVPFEAWQSAIFSPEGALVWASADYRKTGVTPYVHELGARVPSLRRLYQKWPHFTNGSADTLFDVVSAARFDRQRFFHAHAPSTTMLQAVSPDEARDLTAFLELL